MLEKLSLSDLVLLHAWVICKEFRVTSQVLGEAAGAKARCTQCVDWEFTIPLIMAQGYLSMVSLGCFQDNLAESSPLAAIPVEVKHGNVFRRYAARKGRRI